jgi:hypothetical protein
VFECFHLGEGGGAGIAFETAAVSFTVELSDMLGRSGQNPRASTSLRAGSVAKGASGKGKQFCFDCSLADFFGPGFEILLYLSHELVGDGAVDEAVIVAESQVHDGADCD